MDSTPHSEWANAAVREMLRRCFIAAARQLKAEAAALLRELDRRAPL